MQIEIIDENKFFTKKDTIYFELLLTDILRYLGMSNNTELCVTFTDDKTIRLLNKTYRKVDRATDVLSFPQKGPAGNLLGDVLISYQTAKRHSIKYDKGLRQEIKRLIIHGVLHLMGYDHKKKKDSLLMREKENELLNEIKTKY